jgi:hypothetical protein
VRDARPALEARLELQLRPGAAGFDVQDELHPVFVQGAAGEAAVIGELEGADAGLGHHPAATLRCQGCGPCGPRS